jgi:hypothetical protein
MALLKKKRQKRLTKQVNKLVKKHGGEAVSGLFSDMIASAAAKYGPKDGDAPLAAEAQPVSAPAAETAVSSPVGVDHTPVAKKSRKRSSTKPSSVAP